MSRLADIQAHLASMGELLDIVGAMRSLAGMRVQEAQQALPGVRRYAESMAMAIGTSVSLLPGPTREVPEGKGGRALILCAAEHGFVGGFNERLLDAVAGTLGSADALFVLGSRGAAHALERSWRVAWMRPMAIRLVGISDCINHLANELYVRIARGELSHVDVIFGRYRQGCAPVIERHRLLPLDPASLGGEPPRQMPLHNLEPQYLLERLIAEYMFAGLTEAAVESLASENAARFAAMESARDNVSRKLQQLRQDLHRARQTEITSELLDLVTGTEGLTRSRP